MSICKIDTEYKPTNEQANALRTFHNTFLLLGEGLNAPIAALVRFARQYPEDVQNLFGVTKTGLEQLKKYGKDNQL